MVNLKPQKFLLAPMVKFTYKYLQYTTYVCVQYTTYVCVQYTTEVEDSYNGPKLEADITPEFMKDLLKWYKEEKKLHKKYCYKVSIMK